MRLPRILRSAALVLLLTSCTRPDYSLDPGGNLCPPGETWFGCSWTIGGGVGLDSCGNTYVTEPYQSFGWQCCRAGDKVGCDAAALRQLQMGAFGQDVAVACYDTGEQDKRRAGAQSADVGVEFAPAPSSHPQTYDAAAAGGDCF